MESNTNIDLILSMFNQYLYQEAKSNISDLIYYYKLNPATCGNTLVEQLLQSIKDYPLESIGMPLFQSILRKSGKNDIESREILNKIIEYKKYTKEQIEPSKKYLKDVVASVYIQKAERLYVQSPAEYLQYLKNVNFKSTDIDYLNSTGFKNIDMNSIIVEANASTITSSLKFINESFTEGAYKPNDIVVVSMPPSVGKSLFAESEALHMAINLKIPVHMLVMGDLDMSTLFLRFASIYTGLPFSEARRHLMEIYRDMSKEIGDNLDITIAPAGTIKGEDYVQWVLDQKKYKAVFIDYDENFEIDYSQTGMYTEFGTLYNELTKLKNASIFTMVLCQPKVYTWNDDAKLIDLGDLGTSSRKAHIADVVITRNKEPDSQNGLGIFNIAKNRHGSNLIAHSIRLSNGRFKIVPKSVYTDLKAVQEYKNFSEAEIDQMVSNYLQARGEIDKKLRNNGAGKSLGPFGN